MLKKRQKKDTINSWIIKNQKGLSAVVTTLIVILLVLVAVGIMWVVVKGLVQEGAEGVELGRFTLDLEIKRVQIENNDVTVVVVKRNPGEGNFIGMNFVFSDGINSEIIREDDVLEELEERTFTFTLTEISTGNLETISVAPIFELSSGKESTGDIADSFEVTDEMKAGITGGVVSNFEALGFKGMGTVNYSISSQSEDVVKIKKAIVDPLDVLPGDNQTFTVHVYSPYGIINITSTTELDNSTSNLIFLKISEYEDDNETIEIWAVTWIVNDVHAITYRTTIVAIDAEGNSDSVTLTWTDSCQSQITFSDHGVATKTISTTCNTGAGAIGGVDGSNIVIGEGVNLIIDSNAQFIFNQGKSITITASGASITSTTTGSFGNGDLYYTDSDGDNYISGTSASLLIGSGSGRVRASSGSLLGTSDCSDGDGDIYRNVAGMILDNDHDRYSTGSSATRCVGAKSSYWYKGAEGTYKWISTSDDLGTNDCNDANSGDWRLRYSDSDGDGHCPGSGKTCVGNDAGYRDSCTTYTDCCDTDANAKPGQTAWFTDQRGCGGGWDYNCDGGSLRQWTDIRGQCYDCWYDGSIFYCDTYSSGAIGWEGPALSPACGDSRTYISNPGPACRGRDEWACNEYCYGASYGSRTQACH